MTWSGATQMAVLAEHGPQRLPESGRSSVA